MLNQTTNNDFSNLLKQAEVLKNSLAKNIDNILKQINESELTEEEKEIWKQRVQQAKTGKLSPNEIINNISKWVSK